MALKRDNAIVKQIDRSLAQVEDERVRLLKARGSLLGYEVKNDGSRARKRGRRPAKQG